MSDTDRAFLIYVSILLQNTILKMENVMGLVKHLKEDTESLQANVQELVKKYMLEEDGDPD